MANHYYHEVITPVVYSLAWNASSSLYISSMIALFFSRTTLLFSFRVGVSSSPSKLKSVGSTLNFLICWALEIEFSLFSSIFDFRYLITFSFFAASSVVETSVTPKLSLRKFLTVIVRLLVGVFIPVVMSTSTLKVISAERYFLSSPITITLLIIGQMFLRESSISTGATFSPPAVMISSLILPVILTNPSPSLVPRSPL
mmetsp:Transcript_17424/g.20240  ORF Transcript_17424/g.20240 Transcript_17424/m.20240 type:complete len:200 (+) Transcript_17424:8-607(+)